MPLFVCDKCGAIDNTALGHFWARHTNVFGEELVGLALCTACEPDKFNDGSPNKDGGKWHDRFERRFATPEIIRKMGVENFIYTGGFEIYLHGPES